MNNYFNSVIEKLCNAKIILVDDKPTEYLESFLISNGTEIFISAEGVKAKPINEEVIINEIIYLSDFLDKIYAKFMNRKFMDKAPDDVIQIEFDKWNDTVNKMNKLLNKLN